MKKFALFTIFIVAILFFTLFSRQGNEFIRPQIQNYLQAQMENNETIELQEFNLTFGKLKALVVYNKTTRLTLKGDYSTLLKSFDLQYHLISSNFHYKKISYQEYLEINGTIIGDLSGEILNFKGTALNKLGNLDFEKGTYNLKNKALNSDYILYLYDLEKLKKFTKQRLKGFLTIEGKIKKEKELLVTGEIKDFDGLISFTLKEKKLQMHMENVSAQKIMAMMRYPQIFQASVVGDLNYNIKQKNGTIKSQLTKVQLLPNNLTNLIKNLNGFDISKERFDESQFNANIYQKNIHFDFNANNKTTKITIYQAKLNQMKKTIDAKYNISINNKDIGGTIKGDIHRPDINIDSSQYIRQKLNRVIDEHSNTLKEIGIGEKEQKKVKDFFDSFFK